MKKWLRKLLVCLVCVCMGQTQIVRAQEMPQISAQSACMITADRGDVLYAKNEKVRLPMASTTKIMTAILALESGKLDDVVTVPAAATRVEGTKIYAKAGEKFTLRDLVVGLMLASGNDAAYTIACYLGGSMENFSKMMNQKAVEIGAYDTQFQNAHGLPQEGHYTTAYDLALITRYGFQNQEFSRMVSQKSAQITTQMDERTIYLKNHNKLLTMSDDALGVKTGYTKEAGRCLVGAAEKDGVFVLTVTLNDKADWNDHLALFSYAFATCESRQLVYQNQFLKTIKVENAAEDYVRLIAKESYAVCEKIDSRESTYIRYEIPQTVIAPIQKGTQVGYALFYQEGVCQKKIPLVTEKIVLARKRKSFFGYFSLILKNWLRQS